MPILSKVFQVQRNKFNKFTERASSPIIPEVESLGRRSNYRRFSGHNVSLNGFGQLRDEFDVASTLGMQSAGRRRYWPTKLDSACDNASVHIAAYYTRYIQAVPRPLPEGPPHAKLDIAAYED